MYSYIQNEKKYSLCVSVILFILNALCKTEYKYFYKWDISGIFCDFNFETSGNCI